MRFQKGKSGNPSGRPTGTKNKATAQLLEMVTIIVKNNAERLQQDIDLLEPKDRVRVIASLLNYVLPKQQATPPAVEEEPMEIKFITTTTREEVERLEKARADLERAREELENAKNGDTASDTANDTGENSNPFACLRELL